MLGFHLNLSLLTPGHFRTAWRLHDEPLAFVEVEHFRRLAQLAEDAKIHAVFLGDSPALSGGIVAGPEAGLDPMVLLANVAAHTERLGFIVTSSTTYNHPYTVARQFLALDHVTHGRAAVNVVTTFSPSAAANFGLAHPPLPADRYRRAREFLRVVTALWDSWQPGAITADPASGVYADLDGIRSIDHHGEFFDVSGPLSVPGSPQGRPVIVQAGGSPAGLDLAGDFADVVVTVAHTQATAVAFRANLRQRLIDAGRHPDAVKVSVGVGVIVAATEVEAREREHRLYETLDLDGAISNLAWQLGLDPSALGADDVVQLADLPAETTDASSVAFQQSTRALLAEGPLTARELAYRASGGSGHRLLVGSAEQVADDLEAWFSAGAADGFTITPGDAAVDVEAFTRLVVPLLQQRGLFHADYSGATLRENLGLPAPVPLA